MTSGHVNGVVDLHSHVLPGVDDGAADLAAAVAIAKLAAAEGIVTLVATPHTLDGVFDVERAKAHAAREILVGGLASAGVAVEIRVAAEVRYHESIPERLANDKTLTLDGGGRYLLLELPHESAPPGLCDLVFRLRTAGTTPIIAHPERNRAVRAEPEIVAEWLRVGALLQLTAGSLTGAFGAPIRATAQRLLAAGRVHVIATDTHSQAKRPPVVQPAFEAAAELVGEAGALRIVHANPLAILHGDPANAIAPAEARKRRGFFAALRW